MNSEDIPPGVWNIESTARLFEKVTTLIQSRQMMDKLSCDQVKLLANLEGRNILYAKYYLNYLLDSNLSIHKAH